MICLKGDAIISLGGADTPEQIKKLMLGEIMMKKFMTNVLAEGRFKNLFINGKGEAVFAETSGRRDAHYAVADNAGMLLRL